MNTGIVGYGAYVPYKYIFSSNISPEASRLGLQKKALADWDEDSITMAVEASHQSLQMSGISASEIGGIYCGSESPPYAVKPSSTVIADILNIPNGYCAADLQFACKAAVAGIRMLSAQIEKGEMEYGLVIGSDTSQAKPADPLELSAGAAAASLVLGKRACIARILHAVSVSSDTPDFWRREHQQYPSHGGRFTGEPAYFSHVMMAARRLLEVAKLKPSQLDFVIFHMPNGIFPIKAMKTLGFTEKQYRDGLTVKEVGNPYSASVLLGLCSVLDKAKPHQKILMVSYGSGAGSDALLLETTPYISKVRRGRVQTVCREREEVKLAAYERMQRQRV